MPPHAPRFQVPAVVGGRPLTELLEHVGRLVVAVQEVRDVSLQEAQICLQLRRTRAAGPAGPDDVALQQLLLGIGVVAQTSELGGPREAEEIAAGRSAARKFRIRARSRARA